MASILDIGLGGVFGGIFVFLLVYTIVYGVMSWRKWFGDQPGAYAMIAFCIAFLVSIAEPTRAFIMFIAPWYVAMAIVVFFILFIVSMFGLDSEKDFPKIIKDDRTKNWIMIFAVLIFVIGLSQSLGQTLLNQQTGVQPAPPQSTGNIPSTGVNGGGTGTTSFGTNVITTIVHPKVLGMLIFFFIAAVSVYFLSLPAK